MMKFFKQNNNSGFTLVETLVAISIFSTSIIAMLSVLTSGIANTNYAKEKMVAAYLAQEGIEYMRNMRDTFVLYDAGGAQTGWNNFNSKVVGASCNGVNGCYFNADNIFTTPPTTDPNALTLCSGSCPPLNYDGNTGKYNYTTGSASGFVRRIIITSISANQTRILTTVAWIQGSGPRSVSFYEDLFNWVE
ncbi:MAG TPA: prepilin-type N-terminal cleavage/methylation domain-containing protein [Candidatus Paceibacterota bacterium]|nr:prepilin-type N-terminal cleavage/methylation domain-containing protein [Candidatus Paceibacterota bacterium]